jgi:hypothetical protein
MNTPLNADQLATTLTSGGAGWMVASVAAVLPILWSFTLILHFARPYIIRFLRRLTLRFGGDVWWLSYVLFRDGLLVVTLGLSMVFLMPNFYLTGDGLPITAPLAVVVLFWTLAVKLVRDADEDPGAFRLESVLLIIASILYIVPQVYGMEAQDQTNLGNIPSLLVSTSNMAVARPLFWICIGLFAVTGAAIFVWYIAKAMRAPAVPDPGEPS